MQLIALEAALATLRFNRHELVILFGAFRETFECVERSQLRSRVGHDRVELEGVQAAIREVLDVLRSPGARAARVVEHDGKSATIVVSREELAMIVSAMNEVLQCLEEWEFQTRMGWTPEQVRALCDEVEAIVEKMGPES